MAILSSSPLQREFIVQILVYALGLIASPSTLFFGAVLLAGIIHLGVLPMLWPQSLLRAAEAQITETETLLHEECAHRRNRAMANICTRGLARLDVARTTVEQLSDREHPPFRFSGVHRYIHTTYQFYRASQRRLKDVKVLREVLLKEIRVLDRTGLPAQSDASAATAAPALSTIHYTDMT